MSTERYDRLCRQLDFQLSADLCGCKLSLLDIMPFITGAEADLCLYLHMSRLLDTEFEHKILELAKVRILKSANVSEVKSRTYTEGSVSKSETYQTAADFEAQEKAIFDSLSTHRRCRIVKS